MKDQKVEIHIDELVLQGFSPQGRYAIAVAVESELTRLMTENGIPSSFLAGGHIPSLNAGRFDMQHAAKGETVGNNIANSVYKGFKSGQ